MRTCKFCRAALPILMIHRTKIERYITHRKCSKYVCEKCNKVTFIEVR